MFHGLTLLNLWLNMAVSRAKNLQAPILRSLLLPAVPAPPRNGPFRNATDESCRLSSCSQLRFGGCNSPMIGAVLLCLCALPYLWRLKKRWMVIWFQASCFFLLGAGKWHLKKYPCVMQYTSKYSSLFTLIIFCYLFAFKQISLPFTSGTHLKKTAAQRGAPSKVWVSFMPNDCLLSLSWRNLSPLFGSLDRILDGCWQVSCLLEREEIRKYKYIWW